MSTNTLNFIGSSKYNLILFSLKHLMSAFYLLNYVLQFAAYDNNTQTALLDFLMLT